MYIVMEMVCYKLFLMVSILIIIYNITVDSCKLVVLSSTVVFRLIVIGLLILASLVCIGILEVLANLLRLVSMVLGLMGLLGSIEFLILTMTMMKILNNLLEIKENHDNSTTKMFKNKLLRKIMGMKICYKSYFQTNKIKRMMKSIMSRKMTALKWSYN